MLSSIFCPICWPVGQWTEEGSTSYHQTALLADNFHLPLLVSGVKLHVGFVLALLATVLCWAILKLTPFGFEIRALGANPTALRFKGVNVARTILIVMAVSGALAALAGVSEIFGVNYRPQGGCHDRPRLYGHHSVGMIGGTEPAWSAHRSPAVRCTGEWLALHERAVRYSACAGTSHAGHSAALFPQCGPSWCASEYVFGGPAMTELLSPEILMSIMVAAMGGATVILLAALGELVTERAGIWNMGVEGTMLVGLSYRLSGDGRNRLAGSCRHRSHWGRGDCWKHYRFMTVTLRVDHFVTGLGFNLLASGLTLFWFRSFVGGGKPPSYSTIDTLPIPALRTFRSLARFCSISIC